MPLSSFPPLGGVMVVLSKVATSLGTIGLLRSFKMMKDQLRSALTSLCSINSKVVYKPVIVTLVSLFVPSQNNRVSRGSFALRYFTGSRFRTGRRLFSYRVAQSAGFVPGKALFYTEWFVELVCTARGLFLYRADIVGELVLGKMSRILFGFRIENSSDFFRIIQLSLGKSEN